ncbi:MAG: cobalamin B12-binding domain-containing protein [Chloroflexi bacterium]|nr:cobalamin B12-binding domain-containing protein [Chloroflexota bacterium]MBI4332985.1 cobalamin B12-binding domain-containing protein [Chloroflexota bacterium]
MSIVEEIEQAVEQIRDTEAEALVQRALAEGIDPIEVLNRGVLAGMREMGKKFSTGEYFLAELIMGSEIGKRCIEIITPHLPGQGMKKAGVVVIGAVKSDIHSIGKDLVAMQLRISGYEVHDLGIDVSTMKFIEKAREVRADIIGQSAFLVSTIPYTAELVKYLTDMRLRQNFKVIIGGSGTSSDYARAIGADGWAKDCFDAANLCDRLLHRD